MFKRLALVAVLLAGCDAPNDVSAVRVPPRPVAFTQAEVAFATNHFNGLQARSITEQREYCGLIGVDAAGSYVATTARRGRASSCLPPESAGPGVTVVASYHTHGAYHPDFLTEIPSFDDLRTDIEDGIDGYVATPGGRLWFVDARRQETRLICGVSCLVSDPGFEEDPEFPVRGRYTLSELRQY